MLRILMVTALCLGLSGMLWANELLVVDREGPALPAERVQASENGSESATPAAEECYIAMIPIYHINAGLLAQALGGVSFSFHQPQPGIPYGPMMNPSSPNGYPPLNTPQPAYLPIGMPATQTGITPGPTSMGLNPRAPLSAFIPAGIKAIVGTD